MKPTADSWTVVIVGAWNTRLFSPSWVGKNVFGKDQINIEMAMTPGTQVMRFFDERIVFIPSDDRLVFGARQTCPELLEFAHEAASGVLSLLYHTPIRAVGLNLGFMDEDPTTELLQIFNSSDGAKLATVAGEVKKYELARKIDIGDLATCNLRLECDRATVKYHFNFHEDASDAKVAIDSLNRRPARKCIDFAIKVLREAYDATLEEYNNVGE